MRVLEIGVGSVGSTDGETDKRMEGAEVVRVDVAEEVGPDVLVENLWEIPEELGEFDVVVASHALQCVPRVRVIETLRCWAGLVKPGGEMHVIVPDLGWAADEIAKERTVDKMTLGVIFGTQHAEWAYHRSGFTADLLRTAMYAVGLEARASRLGPYRIVSEQADGTRRELIARQIYVVAVRPTDGTTDKQMEDGETRGQGDGETRRQGE